jgi:DNA repair photolyase
MRQGCHCIESRDIGAYDTCLNGCKYCYANTNRQKVRENYKGTYILD